MGILKSRVMLLRTRQLFIWKVSATPKHHDRIALQYAYTLKQQDRVVKLWTKFEQRKTFFCYFHAICVLHSITVRNLKRLVRKITFQNPPKKCLFHYQSSSPLASSQAKVLKNGIFLGRQIHFWAQDHVAAAFMKFAKISQVNKIVSVNKV